MLSYLCSRVVFLNCAQFDYLKAMNLYDVQHIICLAFFVHFEYQETWMLIIPFGSEGFK